MAGQPPPLRLPAALLVVLVHVAVAAHCLVEAVTGRALLHPMMGLHDGALLSARPCTVPIPFVGTAGLQVW